MTERGASGALSWATRGTSARARRAKGKDPAVAAARAGGSMDAAAVEEGTPPLAALTPLALEGTEEEPWEPPTSFPHITNWKPAAAMQRKRRGSVLRTMSKTVDVRVALLGLSGVGKTTLAEQIAHADPVTITVTPVTPVDGHLVTHNPNSNLCTVPRIARHAGRTRR